MAWKQQVLQDGATATGNGTVLELCVPGGAPYNIVAVQVEGITTATVTFEGSIDGSTYYDVELTDTRDATSTVPTATADGLFRGEIGAIRYFRARVSAYTSGTIDVTAIAIC